MLCSATGQSHEVLPRDDSSPDLLCDYFGFVNTPAGDWLPVFVQWSLLLMVLMSDTFLIFLQHSEEELGPSHMLTSH